MSEVQNTTASDGGASTPSDPIDRIQAFLDASGDTDTGPTDEESDNPQASGTTPDKPEDGGQGEDTEPQITTAQLAKFLGVDESAIDVDEDGSPIFKSKIDGKDGTAKFTDLLKTYQLSGHAQNRVTALAEQEKALQTRLQEAEQAVQSRLQQVEQGFQHAAATVNVAREELMREFQAIDWNSLRQLDPGAFAAKRLEFQERDARLNGALNNLNQHRNQAFQTAEQQRQQNWHATVEAQSKRIPELIPEWKDAAIAEKEKAAILQWADKSGIAIAQAGNLWSADYIASLRKAWQHDTLQHSKPRVENLVRTAPKLVKPGPTPQNDGNAGTLRNLKQQVRQSGGNSGKALADWLLATGKA